MYSIYSDASNIITAELTISTKLNFLGLLGGIRLIWMTHFVRKVFAEFEFEQRIYSEYIALFLIDQLLHSLKEPQANQSKACIICS